MQDLKSDFIKYLAQTSPEPLLLEINKAKGIYLYGKNGKKYIDLISGISVSSIGHSNAKVVKAVKNQASNYMHIMVYGEYVQSPQVNLAKTIAQVTNNIFNSVYFVNSGSEAVEGAIKLAKRYTGRTQIIACNNAYHGSTNGAMGLINNKEYTQKYEPLLQNVKFIEFNKISDIKIITNKTAAVIIEPVQGEAGYIPANVDFLKKLRKKCSDTNTLLIFDEVQTAMGRTGNLFAYQTYNVIPDVLLLAKAFGGGMPLGAFAADKKIMSCLSTEPILGHITTFGGHPVSCATALEAIQIINNKALLKGVGKKEALFRKLLQHKNIKEVRGRGLMLAVQLDSFKTVKKVIAYCLSKGLICDWFLFCSSALRIAPPLIITKPEIIKSCKIIIEALNAV